MQRRTTQSRASGVGATESSTDRCPACGEGIEGIEATGTGHRFVGCGHPASARFLPSADDGPSFVGVTIE
jgi:uncharacterized protein (DUF983 family)